MGAEAGAGRVAGSARAELAPAYIASWGFGRPSADRRVARMGCLADVIQQFHADTLTHGLECKVKALRQIARGELRPLRNPQTVGVDEA